MKNSIGVLIFFSCAMFGFRYSDSELQNRLEHQQLLLENDSLRTTLEIKNTDVKNQIHTFLTFQDGRAEEAMNFYINLFDNSKVINVRRWAKEGPVEEGKIMHATFKINGSMYMCSDSPPIHDWSFTPAVSNFVECENEKELQRLFNSLSDKGSVTMPLNNYGFSQKFGWVIDQFGISWQLNLK